MQNSFKHLLLVINEMEFETRALLTFYDLSSQGQIY